MNRLMTRRTALTVALLATATATWAANTATQDPTTYPDKAIRLVVPTPPGGGGDSVARLIASALTDALKHPVYVDNRPGASGALAGREVVKAPGDGYTLLLGITTLVQAPAVGLPVPYNYATDLVPIAMIAKSTNVLVVNVSSKVTSVADLVRSGGSPSRPRTYGSWGNGSTAHFMGERFKLDTGVAATHIPYKGASPMMTDLLSGSIDFAFPDVASASPLLKSERIRVLAVTGDHRLPALPNVPTMAELGYKGFALGGWFGLFAPKGTPRPVVERLAREVAVAVTRGSIAGSLQGLNLEPSVMGTTAFGKFIKEDAQRWASIARSAQMHAE